MDAPRHPGLKRLRWRADAVISTSGVARALRTTILLELTLSTGRVVSFEAPPERLQELRHAVARALLEAAAIETHPVLRALG